MKRQKTFRREAGDNPFKSHGLARLYISMRATAHLFRNDREDPAHCRALTSCSALSSLAVVFRCGARIAMVIALCCAIGLHWLALQSVAWGMMIIDYSKRAPLCQAITQTFDGAHPCSLCHVVSKGKNSEKKHDLRSPAPKIDMICVPLANRSVPPFVPFEYATGDCFPFELGRSPPVPPPRSLPS